MHAIEKHGGFWTSTEPEGELVFEKHEPASDLIGVVFKSKLNFFNAVVYKKQSGEPQWIGLWWSPREPASLFNNEHEAKAYVLELITTKMK